MSRELFRTDPAYEARYGWTTRDRWLLPASAVGTAATVAGAVTGVGIWAVWCVGVQRRRGTGDRRSVLREITSVTVPDRVPRQVSYDSRRAFGWRLDRERLATAVARFAPEVPVVMVD